ncbi:MAG: recombinase family protein [Oscillospiraceae bacterium]|nr:recombinase family protein [Oscillospiraceae bacterium]
MKKKVTNNGGVTAIYVRRSVADRDNNSLSIESQKEDCIRYVGEDCVYRLYCDNGFSGKDTEHRPAFQQMMSDAREGLISRIVVKKYDRFSRNLRDYLNVSEELDKLGVTVYSLSEPFNTETKEGRMMRNNLLNFAESERETIAGRVADAYDTRGRETGFYQGGTMSFGYTTQRMTVNGKKGSVLVPSEQADALRLAYQMYAEPSTSLRDILRYFSEHEESVHYLRTDEYGGKNDSHSGKLNVSSLSSILKNPLYVRADKAVYAYFQAQGYEIIDDVDAYDGVHGVFLHNNADGGKFAKIGYHEGLVDSSVWLTVQDKKQHSRSFHTNRKANNSWLVGLLKCKECGLAVVINVQQKKPEKVYKYLFDSGMQTVSGCVSRNYSVKLDDVEEIIYSAMCERMKSLEISHKQKDAPDMETESIKSDILKLDTEIRSLMDRMAEADDVVFAYIQQRIKELHSRKSELERKLQTKSRKRKAINTKPLTEPLAMWDTLTVQEKHDVAAEMIEVVYISHHSEDIEIRFGI